MTFWLNVIQEFETKVYFPRKILSEDVIKNFEEMGYRAVEDVGHEAHVLVLGAGEV